MDKINEKFLEYLLYSDKFAIKKKLHLPLQNEKGKIELITYDKKEKIWLDINRQGKIQLKVTIQNRYQSLPVVRLDIDSPPHFENGKYSSRNHIHIYNAKKQGNDTYDLEDLSWFNLDDLSFISVLNQFLNKYNIKINTQGVI